MNILVPFLLIFIVSCNFPAPAQAEEAADGSFRWPVAMSLYGGGGDEVDGLERRSLLDWQHKGRYYISYAALYADRVPCPPRSGRSYYTHNCHLASGPVQPYSRGCSAITHCRS